MCGHGHELVASVVKSRARVILLLNTRRVEGMIHVKSVGDQSSSVGVVKKIGDRAGKPTSSPFDLPAKKYQKQDSSHQTNVPVICSSSPEGRAITRPTSIPTKHEPDVQICAYRRVGIVATRRN
ncbi:hypothetical protein TNCV_4475241 [Trichonephila clavipes]|nr:hypothetical protein TNCV_4475241 [Trichonephila clavipes]